MSPVRVGDTLSPRGLLDLRHVRIFSLRLISLAAIPARAYFDQALKNRHGGSAASQDVATGCGMAAATTGLSRAMAVRVSATGWMICATA